MKSTILKRLTRKKGITGTIGAKLKSKSRRRKLRLLLKRRVQILGTPLITLKPTSLGWKKCQSAWARSKTKVTVVAAGLSLQQAYCQIGTASIQRAKSETAFRPRK
jgi:hypothetical protein